MRQPGEIIMADTADTAPARANSTNRRRRASAGNGAARRSRARTEHEEENLEAQVAQLQSDLRSITTTLGRMGQSAGDELKSTAKARADELTARGQSALDMAQ